MRDTDLIWHLTGASWWNVDPKYVFGNGYGSGYNYTYGWSYGYGNGQCKGSGDSFRYSYK